MPSDNQLHAYKIFFSYQLLKLLEWNALVARIANVNLQLDRGIITWSLNKNGSYSVSSIQAPDKYRHQPLTGN